MSGQTERNVRMLFAIGEFDPSASLMSGVDTGFTDMLYDDDDEMLYDDNKTCEYDDTA